MANQTVFNVTDEQSLETFLQDAPSELHVLMFSASWHEPSKSMLPVMLVLLQRQLDLHFATIDAESNANITEVYSIETVPTFIFIENKKEIHRFEGANAVTLTDTVKQYSRAPLLSAQPNVLLKEPPLPTFDSIKVGEGVGTVEKLKELTRQHPVMLFMKGNPDSPRCGFSRTIVDILRRSNITFGSFDILTDESVRQGLKDLSNWPTYPQLYINGDFVGGVDIVSELAESGELKSMLPTSDETKSLETLNDRLVKLINRSHVILFMKGNPSNPKCGFSRKAVALLLPLIPSLDTFDILQDDSVRQGLKEYSKWPTYPQLYIGGELVGGIDVMTELAESGELQSMIDSESNK